MKYRIGITMRVTESQNYSELRDTIASDWSVFMQKAFPEANWLFVPNMGTAACAFVKDWDINTLIFTGGDDIGKYPQRDATELSLIQYALKNNIPIIGICRGMQLIHHFYGGKLEIGNADFVKRHRASVHSITIDGTERFVNSYHTNRILEKSLTNELLPFARSTKDCSIEAFISPSVLGMMWHPERDEQLQDWNVVVIKKFIKNENP